MGFKLPFPYFLANTPVEIWTNGVNEDGDPVEEKIFDGKCIYSDKSKQIVDAERKLVLISGKVTVPNSIKDGNIEGYVVVNGIRKNIYNIQRPLNPDGSIFSTELNLS